MRVTQLGRRAFAALAAGALALALTGGLAACAGQQAGGGSNQTQQQATTRSFTDSCGREVELPSNITKVAASGPVAQQILLTIAPEDMVGLATKLTDGQAALFDDSVAQLPVFGQIYGGKGDFNKEAVADAAPQLVIDLGEAKKTIKEDMDQLQEQLGIPCVHIETSLDSYDEVYRTLGILLGKEGRAAELSSYCKKAYDEVDGVVSTIPESDRPKVAYLLGDSGLNAIAKGSFQGAVVDFVASNAIVTEKASGSGKGQEVSLEQIASFDPQLIVFGPGSIYPGVGEDPAWSELSAIKGSNYYQVPASPYNWLSSPPSVNQVAGMQWLARVCYPQKFQTGVEDVAKDYFKTFYGHDLSDSELEDLLAGSLPRA
nr:ABC transporter substrate-binding protein [uncultured Olsenella sp.]